MAKAHKILLEYHDPKTPVGIVKKAKRKEETTITSLLDMLSFELDMATVLIVGNSTTYTIGDKMVTPRGYNYHSLDL